MTDQVQEDISDTFHLASNNPISTKRFYAGQRANYSARVAALYQEQFADPLEAETAVKLPEPNLHLDKTLVASIIDRRSSRDFADAPMGLEEVATIAFLACGVHGGKDKDDAHRNVPNSGGLGSVELSLIVQNVTGLTRGIYAYDSVRHWLVPKSHGAYRQWVLRDLFYQSEFSACATVFCLSVNMRRLKSKYGVRGYRLGLLDAGHVSQNINLVAGALGLGVCPSAGYIDSELNRALKIDGLATAAVMSVLVGKMNLKRSFDNDSGAS
jgi:SagB-type dehydrogenase family enzyme